MPDASKKLTIRQRNAQATKFTAMINPASYSRSNSLQYTDCKETQEAGAEDNKFSKSTAETLDLDELVLDGTGIAGGPAGTFDVDDQIKALRTVLSEPGGDANLLEAVVDIAWGTMLFCGRLTSMTIKYTLFSAEGKPLRARVKLAFVAYKPPRGKGKSAPGKDTRQVRVGGGDSLPLLCFKAYNDVSLFQAVALVNGLTSLRSLPAGLLLTLPKLG